jgi:hypothetical protein
MAVGNVYESQRGFWRDASSRTKRNSMRDIKTLIINMLEEWHRALWRVLMRGMSAALWRADTVSQTTRKRTLMKTTLIAIASGLMLAATATTSQALTVLTVGDSFTLGVVDPGNGSPATEAALLNTLLDNTSGQSRTIDGTTYTRTSNTLCGFAGACPDATADGSIGDSDPPISTTIDVTNWTYLKAKYGNTMIVWYVANINDTVSIPSTCGEGAQGSTACLGQSGGGLSHWLAFNGTPTIVPDGGTTLGLLGLGMLGLGYLRRRIQ